MRYGNRYKSKTGRYNVTGHSNRCHDFQTVIVDECSMLTEDQLAALLDGLSGVRRLILVGDPRQLPPIGSGRPLVDIVRELEPEGIQLKFPRVDRGYAELTVIRRQQNSQQRTSRADLLLAGWFGGNQEPAADEIWNRLEAEEMDEICFQSWSDDQDLQEKLLELIVKELQLTRNDEVGFECRLGANIFNGKTYFNRSKNIENQFKVEDWQILSPVRGADHGVTALNRVVQQSFRKSWLEHANRVPYRRKINPPKGPQGIIYGDKVINLKNSSKRIVYPKKTRSYVANGDIGIVVGDYKSKKKKGIFPFLVEFGSQPISLQFTSRFCGI